MSSAPAGDSRKVPNEVVPKAVVPVVALVIPCSGLACWKHIGKTTSGTKYGKKKLPKFVNFRSLSLVAGEGFEPSTFGL